MEPARPNESTRLLQRMRAGDAAAEQEVLAQLYRELHALAVQSMQRERADHTLQPTALVHEAWMRIAGGGEGREWQSRAHFLCVAAKAMRHVLVDHARRRMADKRGANATRLELDEAVAMQESRTLDVLALDEALQRLAQRDNELARMVELRFFGGLTTEETGAILGLSVRQVEGAWVTARGWLQRELSPKGAR
jgi:RNA polymerase sigma factor (TIGR02999 family)